MSVQNLVNTAISTAAGAVTSEKTKEEKAAKAQTAEAIKTQKLETEKQKTAAETAKAEAARAASDLKIAKAAAGQEKLSEQKKRQAEKKQKIVRGQPSLEDVQAAQQAAAEQVSTRAAAINTARENMANQREMISQINRADLIRELRQGGYISGRQAKRVIYNLEKGGATNGTTKH